MKPSRILTTIAFLGLFVGTAGQAQSRQRHDGFWIGFGVGGGVNTSANVDDERGGRSHLCPARRHTVPEVPPGRRNQRMGQAGRHDPR